MTRKFLTAALFLCASLSPVSAQNAAMPLADYSESAAYQPREFPAKKKSKPKKEKESKDKADAATDESLPAKTVDTTTVPVSVFDGSGKFVAGLKQSDFKIFADGAEQEILSVDKSDEPVNVVLLIDASPSTAYKIEEIQNYALGVVERLKPEDKVIVIQFDAELKVLSELTADRQAIVKAVRKTHFGNGTSLYDAVKKTFAKYVSRMSARTAVVLLTDGVDTASQRSSYADSLLAAEKSDATVFPIYFDTFIQNPKNPLPGGIKFPGTFGGVVNSSQGTMAAEYELGKLYLIDIAQLSGGRTQAIKNIVDAANVGSIGAEMRVRYQIKFRLPNPPNGQRKLITVRVNRPNLRVQARGSFIEAENGKMPAPK